MLQCKPAAAAAWSANRNFAMRRAAMIIAVDRTVENWRAICASPSGFCTGKTAGVRDSGLPLFPIHFKLLTSTRKRRPSAFRSAPAIGGNLRSCPWRTDRAQRPRALDTGGNAGRSTVRRRTGRPRIGVRFGMTGWAVSRQRLRALQTSLTGRIGIPPAREVDARDERRRPATARCAFMKAHCATPAIRREFARNAADGRSGDAASPSGRRGPFGGQHAHARLCACTIGAAETLLIGRAVRRSGRMSAAPPLFVPEPVASGSREASGASPSGMRCASASGSAHLTPLSLPERFESDQQDFVGMPCAGSKMLRARKGQPRHR